MTRGAFMRGVNSLVGFLLSLLLFQSSATPVRAEGPHDHRVGSAAEATSLKVEDDPGARVLTVRLGPISIQPRSEHLMLPPQQFTIPFTGWITGFSTRLLDEAGKPLDGSLLHHLDFFNPARSNFLCPGSHELIFAAGSELQDWVAPAGIGYPAVKGHPIRVKTMVHNPSETPVPRAYLVVRVNYRLREDRPGLTSIYPAWFFVGHCGDTLYDLQPGKNTFSSQFTIAHPGRLLMVGGHLHGYGRLLSLRNVTRGETVVTLTTAGDRPEKNRSVPVVSLAERDGYQLNRGDVVEVEVEYDNPTHSFLPDQAMGIVFGAFLPQTDEQFAAVTTRGSFRSFDISAP